MPTLTWAEYARMMRGCENDPVSMAALLRPFNIAGAPSAEDEFLLIGHVLDAVHDECAETGMVRADLVIEIAADLGLAC